MRRAASWLALGCSLVVAGCGSVTARSEPADPAVVATAVAASMAPALARLERRYLEERARAAGDPPRARELILETEERLLEILEDPELVALRDLAREEAEHALDLLEAGGPVGRLDGLPVAGAAHLASGRLPVAVGIADGLDRLARFLGLLRQRAEDRDLMTDLCLVSAPSGASVTVYPSSDRGRARETATDAVLPNVWRGSYAYSVVRFGYHRVDCARPGCTVDLLQPTQPALDCELTPAEATGRPRPCRERDGHPPGCGRAGG